MRAHASGILVSVVSSLLAACGAEAGTLDRSATQRAVGRAVAAKVEPNVAATSCPGELPLGEDEVFRCTVRLGSGAGTVRVRVRQTDGSGALAVELLDAVVSRAQAAAQLKVALREQFGRSFQADCGDEARQVHEPGSTFTCVARDADSRREVGVTVVDPAGTLSFEVGEPVDG